MVWYDIWNTVYWWVTTWWRRIVCFFCGHDIKHGCELLLAPDWCARCYQDLERNTRLAEERTIPVTLNSIYCWLADRGWPAWDRLDDWLMSNFSLPSWWEY